MRNSFVRMFCIYNGMPLWAVSYPKKEDNIVLISGLLSALDIFAQQVTETKITNISTQDSNWTFSRLHNQENFYLVFQYPILEDEILKKEQEKISQNLIKLIKSEFEQLYPKVFFQNFDEDVTQFKDFTSIIQKRIQQNYITLNRSIFRDNIWLAKFKDAEKLFTAILLNYPIFLIFDLEQKIDNIFENSISKKFIATLEGLFYGMLLNCKEFKEYKESNQHKNHFPFVRELYILSEEKYSKMNKSEFPKNSCIIKLGKEMIIVGPPVIHFAERLVQELREMTSERLTGIINKLFMVKEKVEHIRNLFLIGQLKKDDLKNTLLNLDFEIRETVIISLEEQIPELRDILIDLCNNEHWDITRFIMDYEKGYYPYTKIICPRCNKEMKLKLNLDFSNNIPVLEVNINLKTPNSCGHEFDVYINKERKVLGYGNIKNIDLNKDIKDLFSKL